MGQSLKKLTPGNEAEISKHMSIIVDKCYDTHFGNRNKELILAEFYRAICETVDEINKKFGYSQFRVPRSEKLEQAYNVHRKNKGRSVTKQEFEKIIEEVIEDTKMRGFGAKDSVFFICGVPLTSLLIKQRLIPRAISNAIFIPGVTSATVFVLAKLNKI